MTIQLSRTIWCDDCRNYYCTSEYFCNEEQIMEEAKDLGWQFYIELRTHRKIKIHLCPDCIMARKMEK